MDLSFSPCFSSELPIADRSKRTIFDCKSVLNKICIPIVNVDGFFWKVLPPVFIGKYSRACKIPKAGRTTRFPIGFGCSAVWVSMALLVVTGLDASIFSGTNFVIQNISFPFFLSSRSPVLISASEPVLNTLRILQWLLFWNNLHSTAPNRIGTMLHSTEKTPFTTSQITILQIVAAEQGCPQSQKGTHTCR